MGKGGSNAFWDLSNRCLELEGKNIYMRLCIAEDHGKITDKTPHNSALDIIHTSYIVHTDAKH